jgi:hypothetical protein
MAIKAPKLNIDAELAAASKALSPAVKRLNASLSKLMLDGMPVGVAADMLYDLKQLSKTLGALTAPFDDLLLPSVKSAEEHFVQTLAVGESSGVQGMKSRVQVTENVVPAVDDWPKFYAHIKKTSAFELLNKAPNRAAIQERWDAKKQVPGVGKFHVKRVSCTKLSGK